MAFTSGPGGGIGTGPRPAGRSDRVRQSGGGLSGGERRALPVFGPGGYCWRPALHQEVLVLKAGNAGETLCVAGARCEEGLEPGEVAISTPGGAAIRLRADGSVEIRGTALRFNGQDIRPGGM